MDTVTQALLGATIAEAGFRSRLGGRAVLFGAVCGVLPDLDVVAAVGGEWASLVHHRGVSHSLVVLPLAALLVGAAGSRMLGSSLHLVTWMHLAFWALITHPLLDLFTAYGTQLFAPISDRRYALDGVAIIDPIYTLPLVVAVFKKTRAFAVGVLIVTTLYLMVGVSIGWRAEHQARAELALRGFKPVAVRALVPIAFPLVRRIAARDEAGNHEIGVWSPFRADGGFLTLKRPDDPLLDRALATPEGRIFRWFADDYLHPVIERSEAGAEVELWDQRYGLFVRPERGPFRAVMRFDASGELVSATRGQRSRFDVKEELAAGWKAMLGE